MTTAFDITIRTQFSDADALTRARCLIHQAQQRAITRNIGDTVEYPRVHGDQIVPAVGVIETMRCGNANDPLADRVLEFRIAGLDGTTDTIRVGIDYPLPRV